MRKKSESNPTSRVIWILAALVVVLLVVLGSCVKY